MGFTGEEIDAMLTRGATIRVTIKSRRREEE